MIFFVFPTQKKNCNVESIHLVLYLKTTIYYYCVGPVAQPVYRIRGGGSGIESR